MRKIFRSYFPTSYTFFFLIAFLAITFFAIFALLGHVRSIFFSHADTQNQSVVSMAASMVNERINAKLIQLQALAYTPSSKINFSNKESLISRLEQLRPEAAKIGYDFIQLTDSEGNTVSTNGEKVDIVETDHFYRAIRGFTVISQVVSNDVTKSPRLSGERIVFLTVPVFSGAEVIGVLTAAIDVQKFFILQNIDIPYSGTFLCLIDKNNNVVEYSGSYLREFAHLTRSLNFFSPLSSLVGSDELKFLKEELSYLAGNMIKHHRSTKDDRLISFASLPHSDQWKLVAVSSEESIRSQQNSIIMKIGALILLITLLMTLTAIYLYVMNWKYKRIRELSHSTIDKTGFHFFKISSDGNVVDFEEDFASFLGISPEKSVFNLKELMDERQTIFPAKIEKDSSLKFSLSNSSSEKTFLLVQIIGNNEKGFFPAFAIDITKDELLQEKVRNLAYTDMTTNVPNRESFTLKVESLNQKCLSKSFKSALLFIDINNSHKIMEIFGHRLFQKMLRETAERLTSVSAKAESSIYNLDSDDFVIVIDDYDNIDQILDIAREVNKMFLDPFMLGDGPFEVSCRIGIVSCPEYQRRTPITPSDMIRYGEITLRLAKSNNDLFILDKESYLAVIKELDMEMDLQNSIRDEELELLYQPIYSFGSNRIIAVEALLSWKSKKHGAVSPSVFIPLAERSGFINKLGDFVIDTSFKFASTLKDKNIFVNFNVSTVQFYQMDFAEKLAARLEYHDLPPQSVGLEITESCLCKDIAELIEKLSMVRKCGIAVSIDDFGTGYCSLSYLKDLPVDYLKIDRSFMMGIETSDKQVKLLKGITNLAKSLGVEIVAEGIETKEQLEAVIGCGCSNIQGFYISKPMNETNTFKFISSYTGPGK